MLDVTDDASQLRAAWQGDDARAACGCYENSTVAVGGKLQGEQGGFRSQRGFHGFPAAPRLLSDEDKDG